MAIACDNFADLRQRLAVGSAHIHRGDAFDGGAITQLAATIITPAPHIAIGHCTRMLPTCRHIGGDIGIGNG
jgi:hypothetical protein